MCCHRLEKGLHGIQRCIEVVRWIRPAKSVLMETLLFCFDHRVACPNPFHSHMAKESNPAVTGYKQVEICRSEKVVVRLVHCAWGAHCNAKADIGSYITARDIFK